MDLKKLDLKKFLIPTGAYIIVTFTLAVLWHLVLLGEVYAGLGYIGKEEPGFLLGFLSIAIQGAVMTYLFQFVSIKKKAMHNALWYAGLIGVFFWTSHVVAYAAKHALSSIPLFFFYETIYLVLQFGIYGAILGWAYSQNSYK